MPVSGLDTVNNVATYASSVLTLGVGQETVPGIFAQSTAPTTVQVGYSYSP